MENYISFIIGRVIHTTTVLLHHLLQRLNPAPFWKDDNLPQDPPTYYAIHSRNQLLLNQNKHSDVELLMKYDSMNSTYSNKGCLVCSFKKQSNISIICAKNMCVYWNPVPEWVKRRLY